MIPQLMCSSCRHVFPDARDVPADRGVSADGGLEEDVTCPACGHVGPPSGVMRPSGFPSLDAFTRNWKKAWGENGGE